MRIIEMTDKILFKKLEPNVKLPERNGAAYDLFLPDDVEIDAGETVRIHLGFACKLPEGYRTYPRRNSLGSI